MKLEINDLLKVHLNQLKLNKIVNCRNLFTQWDSFGSPSHASERLTPILIRYPLNSWRGDPSSDLTFLFGGDCVWRVPLNRIKTENHLATKGYCQIH